MEAQRCIQGLIVGTQAGFS